jgi:hypothetical protein
LTLNSQRSSIETIPLSQTDPMKSVTVHVRTDEGGLITCSALIERDAHHLEPNRITLLGTHEDQVGAMAMARTGFVDWEFLAREDWYPPEQREVLSKTFGTGILRLNGVAQGYNIADKSIQPFAAIEVHDWIHRIESASSDPEQIHYWFLQRPRGWFALPRRVKLEHGLTTRGQWHRVAKLGIRYRLVEIGLAREEPRLNPGLELVNIPAVEFRPLEVAPGDFGKHADRLWFAFRILLGFRFRKMPIPLSRSHNGPKGYQQNWHPHPIDYADRKKNEEEIDPPFFARLEKYLSLGVVRLDRWEPHQETLHAAVSAYGHSFRGYALEVGLTTCVEGLERLVTAFEAIEGLSRELVPRREWRPIARDLKKVLDQHNLPSAVRAGTARGLNNLPTLSLEERLRRMAHHFRRTIRPKDRELLDGVERMIIYRNTIVHGRKIKDFQIAVVERIRAQTLFETLFLALIGCGKLNRSGWPHHMIQSHQEEERAV